jgi:hypothetical protein
MSSIPESVEAAITDVLMALNSSIRSEKATISVGQTKVKSIGYQKKTRYLPL